MEEGRSEGMGRGYFLETGSGVKEWGGTHIKKGSIRRMGWG